MKGIKTDVQNGIINCKELLEAETITVFCGFRPYMFKKDQRDSFAISYELNVLNGDVFWTTKASFGSFNAYSRNIRTEEGFLIDATEEEITETARRIVREAKKIDAHDLLGKNAIPDKYLTKDLIAKKREAEKGYDLSIIEKLRHDIEEKQEILKELENKTGEK